MSISKKIFTYSKKLANLILSGKNSFEIELPEIFDKTDKDYIVSNLTETSKINKRKEKHDAIDKIEGWNHIEKNIFRTKRRSLYWKYAVAASIAVVTSFSIFYFNKKSNPTSVVVKNNILIGTDKATLTLEDGTTIALTKGKSFTSKNVNSNGEKLIYKNITLNHQEEVKYNYLTIPRGGQFFIQLSDSTKVWLNSESQLKYPSQFISGETRTITLNYGEAYFEVSPSKAHNGDAFKVISSSQEVNVLGTQFNIKSYKDENFVLTTLVEGKVAVNIGNKDNQYLEPNQQTVFNKISKEISVENVDVTLETSWRKGLFRFKNKPLKDIMVVLSRWYNIDFSFQNKDLEAIKFTGTLNKKQQLESILSNIKNTGFINDYKISTDTIDIK
ncbi:FecR family protein [Aureibaculum sp. A20]|uniref:FecR family protein n=1 Tax=Aureibaculum flavum TaxID=2795986 RepID=A0ABS0WUE7_9FLAO|nr:FecR family protein [Aureibaculum flavum]MBJ2175536.1 FecR family protein [Aureibaculum flavum]